MRVSPDASPPNMKERCEIDLSPGTRARPARPGERREVAGRGGAWWVMEASGGRLEVQKSLSGAVS
jgi:hypothetical protein